MNLSLDPFTILTFSVHKAPLCSQMATNWPLVGSVVVVVIVLKVVMVIRTHQRAVQQFAKSFSPETVQVPYSYRGKVFESGDNRLDYYIQDGLLEN